MTEPVRILVADDEPIIHDILGRYLTRYGFAVERADDGLKALASIELRPPHLVIADVRMPGMDGLQLLARIRESWPHIPVVVISSYGDQQMESEARRLGAAAFEPKPLRLWELMQKMEELLGEEPV